ncbi:hypothetical protein [Pectobacterium versatile]|uniref:Uncharacterized protein n=1 Tax=Pectobacterium versatile TaxID=2488639 RepID=A0AAW3RNJ1_9GAMM|nr:hypothetical protein [Pectobacterium versatile]MBA0157224.1 hypothetical protein [Pectobacterium versatile]
MMEQNTFVDRFFHSSCELTDFRKTGERDINTLFSFLNNLHSLQDRVREQFGKTISQHPEFKLLRIIRNYHHHVGDVDEFRVFNTRNEFSFSHSEMIIIPLFVVAKAIVNAKKRPIGEKEIKAISEFIDNFEHISERDSFFSEERYLINKGKKYYPGFDIYKCVYNITNIIADICRDIPELSIKECITTLDETYTSANNIDKLNLFCHAGEVPFLTTEGYIIISQN